MAWMDFFKIFTYSFESDPLSRRNSSKNMSGAGVTQPDGMPDLRNMDVGGGGVLHETNEFADYNSNVNRQNRYREYDRLRNIAEVEMVMTVTSDETCLGPDTKVATLTEGLVPIKTLADTKKEPFLVYAWDFDKQDYTLAWAHDARIVKKAKTIRIVLDDGIKFNATPEHRILLNTGEWTTAGELKFGDELMPFYRIRPDFELTNNRVKQFPRIFTFSDGWKHERQFIDEWKVGRKTEKFEKINKACRMLSEGLSVRETAKLMKHQWNTIDAWITSEGFSTMELKWLGKKAKSRRVVGVQAGEEMDVYDLTVDKHENFAGESCIFHNCQKGENNHLFKIEAKDAEIKKELEHLFFHRDMLNFDSNRLWSETKQLFIKGDRFWELVIDPESPKLGIVKVAPLPPETIFRIETTKGRLVEFQQSKDGPDYDVIRKTSIEKSTELELKQSRVIRFASEQIVHLKIGDDRKEFYPYGVSLIEAARGPAWMLRMMEDAMLVYRLTRAPERRVFYIDCGALPPYKREAFMERMKDQFRKKKVSSNRGNGASQVDERTHMPSADEDYWIPITPNANTRIETLPGAQNLGEIDDAKYFRDKLFISLNFPKNYFATEDVQSTRIALSAQDVKFARMIERLQSHIEEGLWQVADRHLKLRGYPEEAYADLIIKMTPPSDWREMSRAEVVTNRLNNAASLKGAQLMSDLDIMMDIMKIPKEEAERKLARLKMQKLEDLKLQVLAQNPQLLGVGVPGEGETELGAEAGGQNPMLAPDQTPDQSPPQEDQQGQTDQPDNSVAAMPKPEAGEPLPDASPEDLRRFDLQVQTYSSEMDREEIDYSTQGN